jgi:3-deoxy-D-manno-octulosonic-acid transferase
LGAANNRVSVTGTMKFDTAAVADRVAGDSELADALGLDAAEPIWVCGSTGPGEERLILDTYRSLLATHPTLRLVIVPRHPERFDEVAALIQREGFTPVRRSLCRVGIAHRPVEEVGGAHPTEMSDLKSQISNRVILGDTMGELRAFYSLARLVFVGRSLVDLGPRQHGSDMIEPAALGKPVIVGPFTANFADAVSRFSAADAIVEVNSRQELEQTVSKLLSDPAVAAAMARRAQQVVLREKGATERHARIILQHLPPTSPCRP